ncbi:MAG: anthranilate phosphoribosyltransferase [Leptospiraceae bacterium]|nr:anthranilate phosphoribosyltransferase [Leptospiraceae bacterium]
MQAILKKLLRSENLDSAESRRAMTAIMTGEAGEARTAAFLTALAIKGETGVEIAACAKAMRKAAEKWPGPDYETLLDTCGTGGDGANTINISTLAAIVLASLGLPVAKHGNRAVSSTSGSADLLEALGLPLNLSHTEVVQKLEKSKLAFLFAPHWHPAMKYAVPVRKALGYRTVFNILGPLTNPAPVTHQVMGVYDKQLLGTIAEAMCGLGRQAAVVLHSADGLDEVSPAAATFIVRVNGNHCEAVTEITPTDFGFEIMDRSKLVIQNRDEGLARTRHILAGEGNAVENRTIAMNAALLYQLVASEKNLAEAAAVCLAQIESGKLLEFVQTW